MNTTSGMTVAGSADIWHGGAAPATPARGNGVTNAIKRQSTRIVVSERGNGKLVLLYSSSRRRALVETAEPKRVLLAADLGAGMPRRRRRLACVAWPIVQAARRAAQRMARSNNMKLVALGLHNVNDVYKRLPPAVRTDDAGRPLCSWRFQLVPFLEAMMLRVDFGDRWDDPANRFLWGMTGFAGTTRGTCQRAVTPMSWPSPVRVLPSRPAK